MIRPVLIELALFLTPFAALCGLSVVHQGHGARWHGSWPARTLATLAIVALLLMLGSFFVLAQFGGAPPGAYVPAHIDETGKFIPGQVR